MADAAVSAQPAPAPVPPPAVAVHPDASALPAPPPHLYVAPSAITKPLPTAASNPSMTAPPSSTVEEIVERPQPKTLARGKWEAKTTTVWLVVVGAAIFLCLYALVRVRSAQERKRRELARITSLKRSA